MSDDIEEEFEKIFSEIEAYIGYIEEDYNNGLTKIPRDFASKVDDQYHDMSTIFSEYLKVPLFIVRFSLGVYFLHHPKERELIFGPKKEGR